MLDNNEVRRIVFAHGLWKARLKIAIASGKTEFPSESITDTHRCELGKWIEGQTGIDEEDSSSSFNALRDFHDQFHDLAGQVVELAVAGNADQANELLHGDFEAVSVKLTTLMRKLSGK